MLYIRTLGAALVVASFVVLASAQAAQATLQFSPSTKQTISGTFGAGTLKASTTATISCSAGSHAGEISSAETIGALVVKFTGCKGETKKGISCSVKSTGASGTTEIVTATLKGTLGTVKTTEATSGAGLLLEPATGKSFATVEGACLEPTSTALEGSIAAEVVPLNTSSTTAKLTFATSSLKQDIKTINVPSGSKTPKLTAFGIEVTDETSDALKYGKEAVEIIGAPPPAPRIEQVDFTNMEPVLIDHTKEPNPEKLKEGEAPEKAKEVGAINELVEGRAEAEWQSPRPNEVKKNWPLAFPRGDLMEIANTRIALEPAASNFLKRRLQGAVTIVGEAKVGTTRFTFDQKIAEAAVKAQMEGVGSHPSYLEATEASTASVAVPNTVNYNEMKIKWTWKAKERGGPEYEQAVGESVHNLFLIYEHVGRKLFFSVLAQDTAEINSEAASQAEVIAGVWKDFSKGNEPSQMAAWEYNPANGKFAKTGANMAYYQELTRLGDLTVMKEEEEKPFASGKNTTKQLLEFMDGECGAWQEIFNKAVKTEVIAEKVQNVKFVPTVGEVMLVKNWKLTKAGAAFPNSEAEVMKEVGVPGQEVETPASVFVNHQIVEVKAEGETKLYDPSYGTEPISKWVRNAAGEETYRKKNIAGFCELVVGVDKCQRAGEAGGAELKFENEVERE